MPKVMGKKFSYTQKGVKDAKAYAKKKGAKVNNAKNRMKRSTY